MWLLLACTAPDDPAKDATAGTPSHDSGTPVTSVPTGLPTGVHTGGVLPGHTGAPASDTAPAGLPAPDFALVDLNPTSPTFGTTMSPRDELRKVSGWYFTHAS